MSAREVVLSRSCLQWSGRFSAWSDPGAELRSPIPTLGKFKTHVTTLAIATQRRRFVSYKIGELIDTSEKQLSWRQTSSTFERKKKRYPKGTRVMAQSGRFHSCPSKTSQVPQVRPNEWKCRRVAVHWRFYTPNYFNPPVRPSEWKFAASSTAALFLHFPVFYILRASFRTHSQGFVNDKLQNSATVEKLHSKVELV